MTMYQNAVICIVTPTYINIQGVPDKFDTFAPFTKKLNISVNILCILKIQNAVNSSHPLVSVSLEEAALSIHHGLQSLPEPAAGGPHGVPRET